jgi:phage terminase large subunit-like protein
LASHLTVDSVYPDRDKFARFAPLESRYEKRQVWHREDLPRAFEAELFSFGSDSLEHDDFEDAMSCAAKNLLKKEPIKLMPNRVVLGGKGLKGV